MLSRKLPVRTGLFLLEPSRPGLGFQNGLSDAGMEAIKYLVKIPEKREVTVTVPPHIRANQMAELILMVRERPGDYANKVQAMKAAANDELFLQDLKEVSAA